MQTERFHKLRLKKLETIFAKESIISVWRKIVRQQLRSLELKDLYDHYDFGVNITDRAQAIRSELLNGTYRVSQPLIYRIEKKWGICRHLVIPQPVDALILQVLVENISEKILANQPSQNAFYSRDKHSISLPHNIEEYGLSWRQQWKKLQKTIYEFNQDKELIVVTDLANYYDSIDIQELRKVFSSFSKIDEVLIDLLFKIIEEISWKPDYLPYSGRGLPTTNIEGIRLLAHSFLFEIDEVIMEKTKNSFTRWMDDIVIGVDNVKEAKETVSAVSDMLKSRGLALNISKTNIYTDNEGYHHFQIEQNRYIDSIENTKKTDPEYRSICTEMHKRFKNHFKDKSAKYWDKVTKRYITTYTKLNLNTLVNILPDIYVEHPGLRPNLLMYLNSRGFSKSTSKVILQILEKIDVFDDLSLYQLCFMVTQWEIPISDESKIFLQKFETLLNSFSFSRHLPSDFYCILWFKAKYTHHIELLSHIVKHQNYWQTDSFLRRQVTAVLSRLLSTNSKAVDDILFSQISSGISSTVTLANQIKQFSTISKLDGAMLLYLFPTNIQRPYPLGKFMVLCSILNSPKISSDENIKNKINKQISDPYFKKWLEVQYNIS